MRKYKCLDCQVEAWRPRNGPCFVCGGVNVEQSEQSREYDRMKNAAKAVRRGTARTVRKAEYEYRRKMSLRELGRGPTPDPFAGEAAQGVLWAHAWAGLDPLPAGDYPARFKQPSNSGHAA
jgi:hypothetical protein